MRLLDLTLESPASNLALDEALLTAAEEDKAGEVLRLWESPQLAVVLGRSSSIAAEVNQEACHVDEVPLLRRSSGGASVVIGPGCLLYSVVLSYVERPYLQLLEQAHQFVLQKLVTALRPFVPEVAIQGTSDLTVGGHKFSGNSLRCRRNHLLYHGTVLYDFDLPSVTRYLAEPPRQPTYRCRRSHGAFITNVPITSRDLRRGLATVWGAQASRDWPRQRAEELLATKFSRNEWTRSR